MGLARAGKWLQGGLSYSVGVGLKGWAHLAWPLTCVSLLVYGAMRFNAWSALMLAILCLPWALSASLQNAWRPEGDQGKARSVWDWALNGILLFTLLCCAFAILGAMWAAQGGLSRLMGAMHEAGSLRQALGNLMALDQGFWLGLIFESLLGLSATLSLFWLWPALLLAPGTPLSCFSRAALLSQQDPLASFALAFALCSLALLCVWMPWLTVLVAPMAIGALAFASHDLISERLMEEGAL